MMELCPFCGTRLSGVVDAFCPECRRDLGEAPARSQAIVPADSLIRQPPPRSTDREESPLDYIQWLERRVEALGNRIEALERHLGQSELYNESFLPRAFAVWGHAFVAHLIILIPFMIIGFCAGFFSGI